MNDRRPACKVLKRRNGGPINVHGSPCAQNWYMHLQKQKLLRQEMHVLDKMENFLVYTVSSILQTMLKHLAVSRPEFESIPGMLVREPPPIIFCCCCCCISSCCCSSCGSVDSCCCSSFWSWCCSNWESWSCCCWSGSCGYSWPGTRSWCGSTPPLTTPPAVNQMQYRINMENKLNMKIYFSNCLTHMFRHWKCISRVKIHLL